MNITHNQANIIANEAVSFMANKAGVDITQILKSLENGDENTINYFIQLLEIGGKEVVDMNQEAC